MSEGEVGAKPSGSITVEQLFVPQRGDPGSGAPGSARGRGLLTAARGLPAAGADHLHAWLID